MHYCERGKTKTTAGVQGMQGVRGVQGVRGTSKNAISLKEPSSCGASSLVLDVLNIPCNALDGVFPMIM